jgi:hypothetical protein
MYKSYGVNNPVTKLWKVRWHGWYVHIICHEAPKWKVRGCQIGWSGWPRNVATTTYPSSRECLVQVPRHIPVIVGRGPILLPNHIVYIQLWNKEVLQHIEVHVTRNGSLGEKEWSVTCVLLTARKIFTFGMSHMCSTTWCSFCDPQMIKLWRFTFPDKSKVASSLKTILSKNKWSSSRWFSISVQKSPRCGRSLACNSCSS